MRETCVVTPCKETKNKRAKERTKERERARERESERK